MSNMIAGWRHRMGFGVHSPFAYTVVNEIVRSPYPYYGYHKIELSANLEEENLPGLKSRAKFVHRVVARLCPDHLMMDEGCPSTIRLAVRLADQRLGSGSHITGSRPLAVTWENDDCSVLDTPQGILVAFSPPPTLLEEVKGKMKDGLVYYSSSCIFAVRRPGMATKILSCLF